MKQKIVLPSSLCPFYKIHGKTNHQQDLLGFLRSNIRTCHCWNSVQSFNQTWRYMSGRCCWRCLFHGCGLLCGRLNSALLSSGPFYSGRLNSALLSSGPFYGGRLNSALRSSGPFCGGRFLSCYQFSRSCRTLQCRLIDEQLHRVGCYIKWSSTVRRCSIAEWSAFRWSVQPCS